MRYYASAFIQQPVTERPPGRQRVNMSVRDRAALEPLPPIVVEPWMCKSSSLFTAFLGAPKWLTSVPIQHFGLANVLT
jgi:hypothetical protein